MLYLDPSRPIFYGQDRAFLTSSGEVSNRLHFPTLRPEYKEEAGVIIVQFQWAFSTPEYPKEYGKVTCHVNFDNLHFCIISFMEDPEKFITEKCDWKFRPWRPPEKMNFKNISIDDL